MITEVKEHQILFKPDMIQALLAKRKTQTRRVIKPQPQYLEGYDHEAGKEAMFWSWFELHPNSESGHWIEQDFEIIRQRMLKVCPYGQPGDWLWVRETWATADIYNDEAPFEIGNKSSRGISLWYKAGGEKCYKSSTRGRWRASIHMPRWASRFELEITNIRVERLQDITEADAIAEGIEPLYSAEAIRTTVGLESHRLGRPVPWTNYLWHGRPGGSEPYSSATSAVDSYRSLWDSINGKTYPWASNPWVRVIEFKQI